jgi:hypothetical protein
MDIVYCWHPARGFFYYCSEHRPDKPEQEVRELLASEILAPCECMKCGKQLKSKGEK